MEEEAAWARFCPKGKGERKEKEEEKAEEDRSRMSMQPGRGRGKGGKFGMINFFIYEDRPVDNKAEEVG